MSDLLPDWEGPVTHLDSTQSTQDLAREMAQKGSPEWALVIADQQTQGRGRPERTWDSAKGGIYLSLILRPRVPPASLAHLSLSTASAVAKAIASVSGLHTAVKPPNDVFAAPATTHAMPAEDSLKKVCGILAEASGNATHTEWIVLGIGVNVNNHPSKSLPHAASIADLAGHDFDLKQLLREILTEFRQEYIQFLNTYRGSLS